VQVASSKTKLHHDHPQRHLIAITLLGALLMPVAPPARVSLVARSWRSAVMMAVGPRGKAAPGGILGGRWPPCHLNASLRPPVFNARPGKTSEKHLAGRHLAESVQASGTPSQALPVAAYCGAIEPAGNFEQLPSQVEGPGGRHSTVTVTCQATAGAQSDGPGPGSTLT
jgi:hypothetical protein